ncbi:MAG: peptidoglycan-associated lipoprotein Pal [Syntrophobacteraceae bacterium]
MITAYGKVARILLVLVLMIAAVGCKKKVPVPAGGGFGSGSTGDFSGGPGGGFGPDEARWKELGLNTEAERREFMDKAQSFENEDVYFDYDAYVLSAPAKKILDDKLAFLKRYPKVKVTIEGHCDERGTSEYNLALGERRANTALQYLINGGASQQYLGTVSYGKERPLATGHDEASWAKNRRDHFVLNY